VLRRADAVLAAIPGIVLTGMFAERAAVRAAVNAGGVVETLSALPLFAVALVAAFAIICYEVVTANAIDEP
jgi:hypothetical protein